MIKYFDGFTLRMLEYHIEHGAVGQTTRMTQYVHLKIVRVDEPDKVMVIRCFEIPKRFDVFEKAVDILQFHLLVIAIQFVTKTKDDGIFRIVERPVNII